MLQAAATAARSILSHTSTYSPVARTTCIRLRVLGDRLTHADIGI
jgi:hypothetical protein